MKPKQKTYAGPLSEVFEDKSQIFHYQTPDFFAFIVKNKYPEYNTFCVTDHWHDEVEFVYVSKGSLKYTVDGLTMILREGQGIFINSRNLHVASSDNNAPCEFLCVILHPLLLCASKYVDKKYVDPIIKDPGIKYVFLDSQVEWQKEILDKIQMIYTVSQESEAELKIQMYFTYIWCCLYRQLQKEPIVQPKPSHHLSTLKEMIAFIQQHYQEKITLEDIAASGFIGKTMCTKLFMSYVNRTPFDFLKNYRIEQSIILLESTDMPVTEISYNTGFSSSSYYAECFKKTVGISPLEYRKSNQKVGINS